MKRFAGRVSLIALGAFAAWFLATIGLQGQANDAAPTDTECEDAWTDSSASDSCGEDNSTYYLMPKRVEASVDTSVYVAVASDGQCRIEVDCLKSDLAVPPVGQVFSGSTDQVEDLNNCDGTLKDSGC